jgi:hypothetical protein
MFTIRYSIDMGIPGFGKRYDPNWRQDAETLLSSVSKYLMNVRVQRGRSRIKRDEYILERKLIFLLDDLRVALRKNDPANFETLVKDINRSWIELYQIILGS